MADVTTAVYKFVAPDVGGSDNTWGDKLNANIIKMEALLVESFTGGSDTDLGKLKATAIDAFTATTAGVVPSPASATNVLLLPDGSWGSSDLRTMQNTGFTHQARLVLDTNFNLVTGGLPIIDSVQTVANDRILLIGQTTTSQNGIYIASTSPWARAADMNTSASVKATVVTVAEGTVYRSTIWQTAFGGSNAIGTSSMVWFQLVRTDKPYTFTGAITFSINPTISNSSPIFYFEDTDAAVDTKRWRLDGSSSNFTLYPQTDGPSPTTLPGVMQVTRDATGLVDFKFLPAANRTVTPSATSVITQERGDARYLQLTTATGASKSTIVEGDNLYPDYNLLDAGFYGSSAGTLFTFVGTTTGTMGLKYVNLPADTVSLGVVETAWITCEPSTEYLVSAVATMLSAVVGSGTVSVYLETGSVSSSGVVTSLGRTLIQTRTDSTATTPTPVSLTVAGSAKAMRFVVERSVGGTAAARAGGFIIRRKVSVAQLAADVDSRYLVSSDVDTNYAKLNVANLFTSAQTIQNAGPIFTLNDTDATTGGSAVSYMATKANGTIIGLVGNNASPDMRVTSYYGNVNITTVAAGTAITLAVANVAAGRIDAKGTATVDGLTVITQEKGDARYMLPTNDQFVKALVHTTRSAGTTLNAADIAATAINFTASAAANLTLPLGTTLDSGFPSAIVDTAISFCIINTGTVATTLLPNTGVTILGAAVVAIGTSASFRLRKTATATWIAYRMN